MSHLEEDHMAWKYAMVPYEHTGGYMVAEVFSDGCYGFLTEDDWYFETREECISTIKKILQDLEDIDERD